MVGYLFVLYKVDKPRKKVRTVTSVKFKYFSKWGTTELLPSRKSLTSDKIGGVYFCTVLIDIKQQKTQAA